MILLAVDTALDACAAAVVRDDGGAAARVCEVIGRGHAEKLMAVVEAALREAGIALGDVDAFAVSIGPGSFTGIRVGVAAVRGFALATGRPAIGVSSLAALAEETRVFAAGRPVLALLDARKDEVYAQPFGPDGAALSDPMVVPAARAAGIALERGAVLVGSGVPLVAPLAPTASILDARPFPDVTTLAALALARLASGETPLAALALARLASGETPLAPAPLYVRAPDAKPQAHARLARLTPTPAGEGTP